MPEYNLLSFSYPMNFKDNDSLADAIAELIKAIGATNVYLLGQSYGGLIAQITAKKASRSHQRDDISQMCGLGKGMDEEGIALLNKMLDHKMNQVAFFVWNQISYLKSGVIE